MNRIRFLTLTVLGVLLSVLLTGCMFDTSQESLYELPKLPNEYTALRQQIDAILADGAENAAPVSGTNVQSVQLMDLDSDGVEEAVAFFKKSTDEKPLKIYIFRAVDDTYEIAAVIEGSGTAIYSIRYVDLDGDGFKEILVGWRISPDIQAIGVYSIRDFAPTPLMFSLYNRYEVLDFDGDEVYELVLLRSSAEGVPVADYYDWEGNELVAKSSARLSMTMAELRSVDIGILRSGETALFITGVAEESRSITDILIYKNNGIVNVVRSDATGVSGEIFGYVDVAPTDINRDGVTEIPAPTPLPSAGLPTDLYWQIDWRSYDAKGTGETVMSTYHNTAESWYFVLPDSWRGEIAVRQAVNGTERETVFSTFDSSGKQVDLFSILTITGNNREYQAAQNGRLLLKQQVSTVYAAAIWEGYDTWEHKIPAEELVERFNTITKEWTSGEN